MTRGSIFKLFAYAVVAGAITTAVAVFIPWLPTAATRQADRMWFSIWFAEIIAIVVFAVVAAALIYCVVEFRVKPGDTSDGPPTHGHTMLEIIWTAIPTVIVIAITIVAAIVIHDNGKAGTNPLVIKVVTQQFTYQFEYPNGKTFNILRLPKDRNVKLDLSSKDVIHSFWVPAFGQKTDAVPGITTSIVITPTRTGYYPIICTQLCGLGHALMRSEAIVLESTEYDSWYASAGEAPAAAAGGTDGKSVYTAAGCGACHVFTAGGSAGTIGSSLDNLSVDAAKAGEELNDFIRSSITDPDTFLAPGYAKGVMPSTYKSSISGAQLDSLVQYLAENTK
ncbi:MAG: cytochrome c oxidase subunit II [Actinobacteria bacterium]|uniref:cytochrome-c oxidase n=1 Tax=freshwater metagenome TaxID=449393 RepID=A0A6J6ND59_9ZZZZ|nr:cytochrome c oxidase subunit II [Actinomycetota bacterium]